MPSLRCKDMGMKCNFEVKDENKDELMQIVAIHADKTHGVKAPFPADMMEKLNKAIKN